MTGPVNRSQTSTAELERRWDAVRKAMRAEGLDALVMQNTSDWVGGYARWFTDIPATNGYPRTVVFYADGRMTAIEMGAFDTCRDLKGEDPLHRGVGRLINTPSFVSIGYTNSYDADLLIEELKRTAPTKIGLLTPGALPFALVSALKEQLGSTVEITDATDLVDMIKAIKSPEEIALIREVADLQDKVFAAVCGYIKPGLRDIDLANFAQAEAHRLGSDQGIFLGTSAPLGSASRFAPRQLQGRTIEKGEHFSMLIEVNGPGGMYVEIARTMVLGQARQALKDAFAIVKESQDYNLSLLKPGVSAAEVAAKHDDWMAARGLPVERRLYAHGQGVDMVERPLIRHDETMAIAENMCLAVHPGYDDDTVFAVICDNYMIGPDGPGACLHKTEKKIFEID